jgi:hypothetical protein
MAKGDLNDLQTDIGQLHHLIEAINDHLAEGVDYATADGKRLRGMDRLNALASIARDLSGKLDENLSTHFADLSHSEKGARHG